ncbi:hypothetical protein ACTWLT_25985, partial [Micromonospora sp. ZYX-F-536]
MSGAGGADGGTSRTIRAWAGRTIRASARRHGGATRTIRAYARLTIRANARRHGGTTRTIRPGGATGGGLGTRAGPRWPGGSVVAGISRRTAASGGRVRRGHRSAPADGRPLAGDRRIGRAGIRLLPGGLRRPGSGGTATGRGVRARVDRRPDGSTAGGALRCRVGRGEPAGRAVGEIIRTRWRRGSARCGPTPGRGGRVTTPVDRRQARVGVRQTAGLAQPVGRSLRPVGPGLAGGGNAALLLLEGRPAAPGAVGRADDRRGAGVAGGRVGHRRGVARSGHHRLGFGGAATPAGGRAGALGRPTAGNLRRSGVDRARATPGGPRITVDGGVWSQSTRDRRHGTGRRRVELAAAGSGRWTGGSRRIVRTPTARPAGGGQWTAGLGGFRAGAATRLRGVGPAQRRHRVRPAHGCGGDRPATGRRAGRRAGRIRMTR